MGPHLATAPGAVGLAASMRRAVRKFGARRGLGRTFGSSEGVTRLCRSAAAATPGRPEARCEHHQNEKARKGSRNQPDEAGRKTAAVGGGYGGQRGPCGLMQGGSSAERAAPAGAMSKRRWEEWANPEAGYPNPAKRGGAFHRRVGIHRC